MLMNLFVSPAENLTPKRLAQSTTDIRGIAMRPLSLTANSEKYLQMKKRTQMTSYAGYRIATDLKQAQCVGTYNERNWTLM